MLALGKTLWSAPIKRSRVLHPCVRYIPDQPRLSTPGSVARQRVKLRVPAMSGGPRNRTPLARAPGRSWGLGNTWGALACASRVLKPSRRQPGGVNTPARRWGDDMGRVERDLDWLELGVRLRARRTQPAIRREDVARPLRMTAARLGSFERGASAISAVELRRLAAVLDAPIGAFLLTRTSRSLPVGPEPTPYELLAGSDDGAALAEAFVRLRSPRLRRHLVGLAEELVVQEARGA